MNIDLGNKYIFFELIGQKPKTQSWAVVNKNSDKELGVIEWYYAWRQYIFQPVEGSIYNNGCLNTIIEFINRLNKEKILTSSK